MAFNFSNSSLGRFRLIAILEGISFLLLLFICMPLKYLMHIPQPVKYVGWIHGILFILYVIMLLIVAVKYRLTIGKIILAFVASIVPFGTFILDKQLKKEDQVTS